MYGLIYCATNTVNGKKYVGQTVKSAARRWQFHLKSAEHGSACSLHCAIRKYGAEVFRLESIDSAETSDELNKKETYHIGRLKTLAPGGYNLTTGGEVRTFSAETLAKMSKIQLRRMSLAENLQPVLDARGWRHTEESKRKMSEASHNNKKTNCPQGHPYDAINTYVDCFGNRRCLTCVYLSNIQRGKAKNLPERLQQYVHGTPSQDT